MALLSEVNKWTQNLCPSISLHDQIVGSDQDP